MGVCGVVVGEGEVWVEDSIAVPLFTNPNDSETSKLVWGVGVLWPN